MSVSTSLVSREHLTHYRVALEAIVESALVTWFGLLFYVIAASAPTGHYYVSFFTTLYTLSFISFLSVQTRSGVGFIASCILPFIFVRYRA